MAQRTTPEDGPRLGRLTGAGPEAVNAVALVLPS
ncbi:alpha/beta hydrolase, partial [Streptomyces sp. SID8380]|nr:alpha/beta hydrolase [Streptomyces sp. SID8380]